MIIGAGVAVERSIPQPVSFGSKTLPVEDKLAGSSIGQPTGIRWVRALDDRGAVFSATNSSRIEYPGLIPLEGTLEFWIKVNSGYHYANSQFNANQDVAMIFSSDAQGGDVTWPGTTILTVSSSGTLSYRMATKMGDTSTMPIEARGTKFRFAEWHALGVSYGAQGEYIMLDGRVVASAPKRTQTFGQAGNHQEPLDIPTIGETVSHFWAHHRYEGGFEGILGAFRVSARQQDWMLAQGFKTTNAVKESGLGDSQPTQNPIVGSDDLTKQSHSSEPANPAPPRTANPAEQQALIKHLAQTAQALVQQRKYEAALGTCNEALALDPQNEEVLKLRTTIEQTMQILVAPAASAEKIPKPVPETSPAGTAKGTQELVLTLDGCRIGGYYLLCNLGVTSHGADRNIQIATWMSRLVDSAGRQHQPSNLTLGGKHCSVS
jgi:hypothetical protein